MRRVVIILCYIVLASGFFWLFPLFHIVRTATVEAEKQHSEFDAARFAESFWDQQLVPSLNGAPDAAAVLKAFRDEPQSARERFRAKVGISRTPLAVIRGSGAIVSIGEKGAGVALTAGSKEPDIILQTGLLFGNTVRDATGLLDPSNYSNSQQFNDISTELNRIVEARVIPMLKDKATVGGHVRFAGCAQIPDKIGGIRPLAVIPVEIHFE